MKRFLLLFFLLTFCVSLSAQQEKSRSDPLTPSQLWRHKTEGFAFKPYIDQLRTVTGRNILLDGPSDHRHHHALMFALKVDEINFWEEFDDSHGRQELVGKPIITSQKKILNGQTWIGETRTGNLLWRRGKESPLLQEKRIQTLWLDENEPITWLSWRSELSLAPGKEKAQLGGSHYFGLGLRFNRDMDKNGHFFSDCGTPEEKGERFRPGGDEFLTPCRWMAYTASLAGKPVTVALFDLSVNPRPMTAFTMGQEGRTFAYLAATVLLCRQPIMLTGNQTIVFEYGIALWEGKQSAETVQTAFDQWLLFKENKK